MSRRGHFLGGGTTISRRNREWFKEGSTDLSDDERRGVTYAPARTQAEQAEYERFVQRATAGGKYRIVSKPSPNKAAAAQIKADAGKKLAERKARRAAAIQNRLARRLEAKKQSGQ